MSTGEFIARIFSFPVIPHSARSLIRPRPRSQRTGALFRRTLSPVSYHPDILHYTLARLIPRFIVAEEALRSGSNPRIFIHPRRPAMTLRKSARYKTSTPPQHLGASFTARRFGIYRVICHRSTFSPPRGYFRPLSGRVNFQPIVPIVRRNVYVISASRDEIKCIMPE